MSDKEKTLVERLRQYLNREETMLMWDHWMRLRKQTKSSLGRDAFEAWCDMIDETERHPAADRIEALNAEIARLRDAGAELNNHACHDDDCQIVTHGVWSDPIPCTCGYEDAWKLWSAALGGNDE